MGEINEIQLHIRGDETLEIAKVTNPPSPAPSSSKLKQYILISTYTIFILAGQTVATLLGRFYYNKGGKSTWLATVVTSGCLPILLPFYFFLSSANHSSSSSPPPLKKLILPYILIGIASTLDNLMYSYGLLYLPVSTFSLVSATQLAFNAVFSYFLNSQKLTSPVLNSIILVTFSAALLGVSPNHDDSTTNIPKGKYPLGFVLTLAASAVFSLLLSVTELMYQKVLKTKDFFVIFEMMVWTGSVASMGSVVGLFVSGEWKGLGKEMEAFETGKVSYMMTLAWIAIGWQVFGAGLLGLTFVVSSLFSNMICTVGLPLVPVFAVMFFKDEMDGVKVLALLLAVWGFVSYLYQDYLDYVKGKLVGKKRDGMSLN